MNIHDGRKVRTRKPFNFLLFWHNNKKLIKRLFIIIIIFLLIFYPIFMGGIIGNWIKDFLGTIINILKTI